MHTNEASTQLDPATEKKLLRKLDLRIIPWIFILYFLSVEDRINVGYSFTMNKQEGHDLASVAHLTSQQNSIGLGLFYVAYIAFEVPSNLIMANVNPAYWIARIMITWSIVTGCMAAISQTWHFYLLRFLLGVFEAGFWPGIAYYTTLWYRPEEVSSRLGFTYLAGPLSGAFGGLISYLCQFIDGRGHLYGFQWLFLIFGILSIIFGLLTPYVLPSTPDHCKRFLTEDERRMAKQRLIQGFPGNDSHQGTGVEEDSKAGGIDTDAFSRTSSQQEDMPADGKTKKPSVSFKVKLRRDLQNLKFQLTDYKVWLFCVLYFTPVMAATSLGYFLPKIVQEIGTYNSIQVSLMSIPPYIFGCVMVLVVTRLSDRCQDRGWFIITMCVVSFTGFVILTFAKPVGARYFGLMIVAGGTYPTVPLSMAWTANCKEGAVAIASATGIVSSMANFGALITTFALYSGWPVDAPNYTGSNMVVGSAMLLAAVSAVILKIQLKRLNSKIDSGVAVGKHGRTYRYLL
ncbi:MFS general substrate transporter [Hesseltinella vesiculosa]|uniref:MFS general substrate transporter n=1 Tax=Hesseltinella vesiculosa TaxID=101127 RepID=A0A1X2GG28_9FUNG|nr:MFS general substrate transporter [Hesseltinella vesiculosa]